MTRTIVSDHTKNKRGALLRRLGTELNLLVSEARAMSVKAARQFEPELSSSAFQVLLWLHAHGASRASQIAEGVAMDRSVVSRLLKELRYLGLLDTARDSGDRRGIVAALSEAAQAKVAEAIVIKGALYKARLREWSDEELRTLADLIARLNHSARTTSAPGTE